MWLSKVLHLPNYVGKYFLRRVPYCPITLLYQGTAGQSPQVPPICPPLKTCPSRPFLHIRHLLGRTVVSFFVTSRFHYGHRIADRLSCGTSCVRSYLVTLASKLPRGSARGSAHCTSTTPWCRCIFKASTLNLPLESSQKGLWRLHTAVGTEAALSPYPSAARIGNAAFQVTNTDQDPIS